MNAGPRHSLDHGPPGGVGMQGRADGLEIAAAQNAKEVEHQLLLRSARDHHARYSFFTWSTSANASRAMRVLSMPAGTPQYTATCSRTSRISSRVTPLLSAALTCNFSSCGRFSALIIAMLMRLRSRSASPGRVHTYPQQYSVASSCMAKLNSSAPAMERST